MSRFLENLWNEIKDPSTNSGTGATGADDYEVDNELIRQKKLTYKGRDENGNRIWEDDSGHRYVAAQLQKHMTDEGGAGSSSSANGSVPAADDWKKYVPGGGATVPANFGQQYFGAGNPVLKAGVANPFVATVSKRKVTAANIEPQSKTVFNEEQDDEKGIKSYLYIVSKDSKTVDDAARVFFAMLNNRAGGIFTHRQSDGGVFVKQEQSIDNVETSDTTSKFLANTVLSGILGGTGFNHALRKHDVYIRVIHPDDPENADVLFDSWDNGKADLRDFAMLLMAGPLPDSDITDNYASEILQASQLGRMICERCATNEYERVKGIRAYYGAAHKKGVTRECQIVNEMSGSNYDTTKATDDGFASTQPMLRWFYPGKKRPYMYAEIYLDNTGGTAQRNIVTGSKLMRVHL